MKRAFILLIALLIAAPLASLPTASAQGSGPWFVWIYNAEEGRLVQVAPNGLPWDEIPYPLPPDVIDPPYQIAFSRDARYLAGCLRDTAGNSSVRVYDFLSQTYVAAYIMPGPVVECSLARYSFSEDGSRLAFGVLNHYAFESADPRPTWELMVMDVASGFVVNQIQSNSPQVLALGVEDTGKLPFVVTFQQATASFPGLITFIPVQWGTEGMCEYPSLIWNLTDNTVRQEGPYGKGGLDVLLGSSELVWLDIDPSLPQGTLEGPGCTYNAVMYSNKAGALYPIFHNATVLNGTEFVDNGRRVLLGSYVGQQNHWVAIDRQGMVTEMPADMNTYEVWGTPTGYAFIQSDPAPGAGQELRFHAFTGGPNPASETAWNGAPGEYWRIVWTEPLPGEPGLPAFPSMYLMQPSPTPSTLVIGGAALVHTTEGDQLRVRSGPGLGYAVVFSLTDGAYVMLREGPRSAEGLVWWRVETPDRRTGWAVEGVYEADGYLQTLVPTP